MSEKRLSWDQTYIEICFAIAKRSPCVRRRVGACAVDTKNRVIATGYNGPPSGEKHCTEETCLRNVMKLKSGEKPEVTRAIHAEQNVVAQGGSDLVESTVYCTTRPCTSCFKSLMGSYVRRIVWLEDYDDPLGALLMSEWGDVVKTPEGFYQFTRHPKK